LASHKPTVASIDVRVAVAVANDLLNRKRQQLTDLERASGQSIRVHGENDFAVDEVRVSCTDRRGREVAGATMSSHGTGGGGDVGNGERPPVRPPSRPPFRPSSRPPDRRGRR
jgi:hypothetical protein